MPQSKTRRIFDLLLVIILLSFMGLILLDYLRHRSLRISAESLKVSLEKQGLPVSDIQTGCSNPIVSTEFGDIKSKKHCRMTMFIAENMNISEANHAITTVNDTLRKNREYDTGGEMLPLLFDAPYDSPDYGLTFIQKSKGAACTLTYTYDSSVKSASNERHAFKLLFDCDDTPWLNRSFL